MLFKVKHGQERIIKIIVGVVGGIFVFVIVLSVTAFLTNNLVEGKPTYIQLLGYAVCLVLSATAGWSSFRAAKL